MSRFEVLIINTVSHHMTTGDYNLTEQDAIALRNRLNDGNLRPQYIACEIPTPFPAANETASQSGPDEAAASHPAA